MTLTGFIMTIAVVALLFWTLCLIHDPHLYRYRTPYSRACVKCGKQDDWHEDSSGHGWWEEMVNGSGVCDD